MYFIANTATCHVDGCRGVIANLLCFYFKPCFHLYYCSSSIVVGTIGCLYILANFIRLLLGGEDSTSTLSQLIDQHAIEYGWILKLMVNCFGYSCVFVPGILIYHYTKQINYTDGRSKCFPRLSVINI